MLKVLRRVAYIGWSLEEKICLSIIYFTRKWPNTNIEKLLIMHKITNTSGRNLISLFPKFMLNLTIKRKKFTKYGQNCVFLGVSEL